MFGRRTGRTVKMSQSITKMIVVSWLTVKDLGSALVLKGLSLWQGNKFTWHEKLLIGHKIKANLKSATRIS